MMLEIIEMRVEALRRIVMALAAMADAADLPRRVHRALLLVLRPAEAAARRLVIAFAAHAPNPEAAKPHPPQVTAPARRMTRRVRHFQPKMPAEARRFPGRLSLPLLDPAQLVFHRRRAASAVMPRICVPGHIAPAPLRPLPLPGDLVAATRLRLRLDAVLRALDDLPGQTRRFRRWQARRAAARQAGRAPVGARHRSPLRPGNPPGWRENSDHLVQDVLRHAHQLAWYALHHPS